MSHPDPGYPEYPALREEADRRSHGFVDPVDIRVRVPDLVRRRGDDWAYAVLGRAYHGPGSLYGSDMELLKLADERDVAPPLPERVLAARRAEEGRRDAERAALNARRRLLDAEWAALVAALPVAVVVAHNYQSGRHCENGYVQGGDHILVKEEVLVVGRLARLPGSSLCWTRSRANGLFFPDWMGPDERWPTCKLCIRTACRVTGLSAPTMLDEPPAGHRSGVPNRVFTRRGRRR